MGVVAAMMAGDLRSGGDGVLDDERQVEAAVVELLPSALVRVRLDGNHELIAHLPGHLRANFVRLRVGDRVQVAVSAHDRTRGRVLAVLIKR